MARISQPYTKRHTCGRNILSMIKFQLLEIIIELTSLSISPGTLLMKKEQKMSKQAEMMDFD